MSMARNESHIKALFNCLNRFTHRTKWNDWVCWALHKAAPGVDKRAKPERYKENFFVVSLIKLCAGFIVGIQCAIVSRSSRIRHSVLALVCAFMT